MIHRPVASFVVSLLNDKSVNLKVIKDCPSVWYGPDNPSSTLVLQVVFIKNTSRSVGK